MRQRLPVQPPAAPLDTRAALAATDLSTTRVVKTVRAHHSGSQRWHRHYGDQLLCVRYREDPAGLQRYVTVELLVEQKPVRHRPLKSKPKAESVQVYIGIGEHALRTSALQAGATCDPHRPLWHMPLSVARALGLSKRIVSME